jgi:hypothetical protein
VPLQLEEACLLLHDLAQQESEQLFVVSRLHEILSEALFKVTKKLSAKTVRQKAGNWEGHARAGVFS